MRLLTATAIVILLAGPAAHAQEIYMMSSEWSRWSPWSFCSAGVRVRVRACSTVRGFKCIGHNKEFQSCDDVTTTTEVTPKEKNPDIDDPWNEDRSMAMKQLYPDYDQPVKANNGSAGTPPPFSFKNNELLQALKEGDNLSSLISRSAHGTAIQSHATPVPIAPSTSAPTRPITRTGPSERIHPDVRPFFSSTQSTAKTDEYYSYEEYEDENNSSTAPQLSTVDSDATAATETTPSTTKSTTPKTTPSITKTTTTTVPRFRVATVTQRTAAAVTARLQTKTRSTTTTTTEKPREELESLEHIVDAGEDEGSDYDDPTEGDDGLEEKPDKKNKIIAAASKTITQHERHRTEEEEEELKRRKEDEEREQLTSPHHIAAHKVDGGDDDIHFTTAPTPIQRPDLETPITGLESPKTQERISSDPFESHNEMAEVQGDIQVGRRQGRRKDGKKNLEYTFNSVNSIIEKLEAEELARMRRAERLTVLQQAYLKRSRDLREQLIVLIQKEGGTVPATTKRPPIVPPTTTPTITVAQPPEPLNPKVAEDTVKALDWLMKNINTRLEDGPPTLPTTTTTTTVAVPRRVPRPSYMKGIRLVDEGEEIHPNPVRIHSLPSQREFVLPSKSVRIFNSAKELPIQKIEPAATSRPAPIVVVPTTSLPLGEGIEPIPTMEEPNIDWSDWSMWSECVCGWQLRKRICIPNDQSTIPCPAPEYQRKKCEGGTCRRSPGRTPL